MTRLVFQNPIPQHIMQQMYAWFAWEPADTQTCNQMQRYLNEGFPGPTWFVYLEGEEIHVKFEFADPRELTAWLLKWS